MLLRLAKAALAAGLVAGLLVAALQEFTTTPLIIQAEQYEGQQAQAAPVRLAHLADPTVHSDARVVLVHGTETHGDTDAWAPEGRIERTAYTSLATVGTAFGFALVLLGAMVLSGTRIDARTGLMWGAAAFVATGLAPALGLSPELPGSAAADITARQMWWVGTALATAVALYLALRVSTVPAIAIGLGLIVAPHVIGAPHPHEFTSQVPSELSGQFAAASLVVHAAIWALTGAVAGFAWQRLGAGEDEPATA